MFSIFMRRQDKLEAIAELQRLRRQISVMHGQISALTALVGVTISQMNKAQRKAIISDLKTAVGQGFRGQAQWLNDEEKRTYNSALSATIQAIIKKTSEP